MRSRHPGDGRSLNLNQFHSLLKRQLRRYRSPDQEIPIEWKSLVEAINEAYHQFDSDRIMLERSLDLSSQELISANTELEKRRQRESQENAERVRFALEAAGVGICEWDAATGELKGSETFARICGLTADIM